jgi:hypothetical protein
MAFTGVRRCTICGAEGFSSGGALRTHIRNEHAQGGEGVADDDIDQPVGEPGAAFGTPTPPSRSKAKAAPKRRSSPKGVPVAEQIAMLYKLGGQMVGGRGLPATGGVLQQKAPEAGAAWDAVLKRFPAVYEMLEKGMIAGDVLALVWVHLEILQVARQEIEARNAYYAAQGPGAAAA